MLTSKILSVFITASLVILTTALRADEKLGGGAGEGSSRGVRSFGAVGDGVADDTAAIQRAIDQGVGDVRLNKGTYRITKSITIDLQKNGYTSISGNGVARVVMAGPGPAFKFVGTHFKSADPEGFASEIWDRQRMPLMDGVAILGEHTDADGIAAVGTMQLTLTRLHLRRLRHGIQLAENNRNVLIADCHIYENRGIGLFYDNVNLHQSNVSGCHISYCRGGGIVARGGNVRNIHVSGCDLESNMGRDTPPTANFLIDCTGSEYGTGEVAITGCTIQHNNPSPDSANIRIIGRSKPTERAPLVREGNVTITGNVLSDVQTNIHLRECRGVAISGNTFWQGYKHNLLIEESTNIVIGANNMDRNPRYDYGNTRDANNSVIFRNCSDCNISGLHITNVWRSEAGLLLENCRRMNITNCTILDCQNAGLLARNLSLSRISDCIIRNDLPGENAASLVVQGGSGNIVTSNAWDRGPQVDNERVVLSNNTVVLAEQ